MVGLMELVELEVLVNLGIAGGTRGTGATSRTGAPYFLSEGPSTYYVKQKSEILTLPPLTPTVIFRNCS